MVKNRRYTIEELRDRKLILLEYISGSQMYGTNTDKSDVDIKGIFIMPDEDFSDYNFSPDWEEVESGKITLENGKECEIKFYELRKFLQLLEKNNPNSLEIFDIPADCLIYKHPLMDMILEKQKEFVTKKSWHSFSGYALEQTNKAHGSNKKQNWEKGRIERKSMLDFCHVPWKQGSLPFNEWLKKYNSEYDGLNDLKQEDLGLVKIPHMPFSYGIYKEDGSGFAKGILTDEKHTNLKLSNIPIGAVPIATMQYNENAWKIHCEEYRSYSTWLKERNEQRWVDVKGHDQKIDGKNMLHMQRLINMAADIAHGKGIVSRRPEAVELLKIRKGETSLQELLDTCQAKLTELKKIFMDNQSIPEEVPKGLCAQLNTDIRQSFKKQ